MPTSPDDALAVLYALPRFTDAGAAAFKPGLDRMRRLLAALGDPHRAYPSLHVAGTNGKGSTASMLAAIATAGGRRTGLHTSPHLLALGERMRLDGTPAPEAWIAEAVARHHALFDAVAPSFFEATTALSLLYFAEERVDLAVVETGLGGRLDATNVLRPEAAVVTHIGLDHTDLLGATLPEIAREKAGIIKPHTPVFTAVTDPEAHAVLAEVAALRDAPLHDLHAETIVHAQRSYLDALVLDVTTPVRRYDGLRVGLAGRHQASNALLAVRGAEAVLDAAPEAIREGLANVRRLAGLRARLEVVQRRPLVVVDVGHNPDGLAAALAFVQAQRPAGGRLHVVLGLLRDKDATAIGRLLAQAGAIAATVSLPGARGTDATILARTLRAEGAEAHPTTLDAARAHAATLDASDALLVVGSHQVAAAWLGPAHPPAPSVRSS